MRNLNNLMIVAVAFVLVSCSATGTGTKDKSEFLSLADSKGTLIFIQRSEGYGGITIADVSVNGSKIAGLAAGESTTAKANFGSNTLSVIYSGISGAFKAPRMRDFSMLKGQKRYFVVREEDASFSKKTGLRAYEITKDEFFSTR